MSEDWWTHIVVIKEKYLWSNLNQRERISFKLLKFHGQYIYHGEDLVSRFSIHLPSFDVLDSLFSGFLERYINTISGNSRGNKSSKFQFLYFFSALTSSRCNSLCWYTQCFTIWEITSSIHSVMPLPPGGHFKVIESPHHPLFQRKGHTRQICV